MKEKTKLWITAIICGTVLIIAVFIWPTPYTYQEHGKELYRISRLTGGAKVFDAEYGWSKVAPNDVREAASTTQEVAGSGYFAGTTFHLLMHNGSKEPVAACYVTLGVTTLDDERVERTHFIEFPCSPYTTREINFETEYPPKPGEEWSLEIYPIWEGKGWKGPVTFENAE